MRQWSSSTRSGVQEAVFFGWAGCAAPTDPMIRCARGFDGVVPAGRHVPEVVVRSTRAVAVPRLCGVSSIAFRQLPLCSDRQLKDTGTHRRDSDRARDRGDSR